MWKMDKSFDSKNDAVHGFELKPFPILTTIKCHQQFRVFVLLCHQLSPAVMPEAKEKQNHTEQKEASCGKHD